MCLKICTTSTRTGNGRGPRLRRSRRTDKICQTKTRKIQMTRTIRKESGSTPLWASTGSSASATSSNSCTSFRSIKKERRLEKSRNQRFSPSSTATRSSSSSTSKWKCWRRLLTSLRILSTRWNKMMMTLSWRIRHCAAYTSSFQTIRKDSQSKSCFPTHRINLKSKKNRRKASGRRWRKKVSIAHCKNCIRSLLTLALIRAKWTVIHSCTRSSTLIS